jgi:lipoprotein NlpD
MIASVCALSLWACVNPQVGMRRTDGANTSSQRVRAPTGEEHRVQKGETLYAIAFRYAIDFRDLATWNQIPEPFTIYPNQRLRLKSPVRAPQLEASAVRSGGTSSSSVLTPAVVTTSTTSASTSVSTTTIAPVPTATVASTSVPAIQAGTAVAAADGVSVGAIAPPPTPARTESLSPTNAEGLPTGFTAPSPTDNASTVSSTVPTPTPNNSTPTVVSQAPRSALDQQMPATTASTSTTAAIAPSVTPTVAPSPTIAPSVTPSSAPKPIAGRGGWGWPAAGKTISTFSVADPKRQGIDVAGSAGDGVYAAKSGEVVYSGRGITGYGELIVIKHDDATLTAYGHNRSRLVKEGQNVTQGQQIAEMGKDATGRQLLHFEVRRNGKPIDPMTVLPAR